jgi:hypothetical protein
MSLKKALLEMVDARDGGVDSFSLALGLPVKGLHNRIYADDGMNIGVKYGLKMQDMSKTTFFAEAIANLSGGVFVKLPDLSSVENDDISEKFMKLHADIGAMSKEYFDATRDGEIDADEKKRLMKLRNDVCKTMHEWLALSFQVYCK